MTMRPAKNQGARLSQLLDGFVAQGCTWKKTKGGVQVYAPSGAIISLHTTESDHRSVRNARSQTRRAGLEWPLDPEHVRNRKKNS